MDAILFVNYVNNINGALIDVCEYFFAIFEHNKNIKLLIVNYNKIFKKDLLNLIYDRYDLDNLDFEKNIIEIDRIDLIKIKFNRLLITDYGTINRVKGIINIEGDKSKIIILSDLHTDKKEYLINKQLYPEGCVTYYGEMPFVYKDHQYQHKFLFDRYKPIQKSDKKFFIHSPENNDYSFLDILDIRYEDCIFKTSVHKNNLFELYSTFLYYHGAKWFDPRPRLMHESKFYGKDVIYINKPKWKDGSYYRYHDLINNGLKNRFLNKQDEIVRLFI